jgi:hypothetical protein
MRDAPEEVAGTAAPTNHAPDNPGDSPPVTVPLLDIALKIQDAAAVILVATGSHI